jgi:hypothetical protein
MTSTNTPYRVSIKILDQVSDHLQAFKEACEAVEPDGIYRADISGQLFEAAGWGASIVKAPKKISHIPVLIAEFKGCSGNGALQTDNRFNASNFVRAYNSAAFRNGIELSSVTSGPEDKPTALMLQLNIFKPLTIASLDELDIEIPIDSQPQSF